MPRRDDVVATAVAILRESGPRELTSVNVAARLGISQPAIYRHIRDMDELTQTAVTVVVDELMQVVVAAADVPAEGWEDGAVMPRIGRRLARIVMDHGREFDLMERFRHDPGELGEGIREVLSSACHLIARTLEQRWRHDLEFDQPFDAATRRIQLLHAQLMVDDFLAAAHASTQLSPRPSQAAVERMLTLRIYGGWCGYAVDMARRCGCRVPEFDSATLRVPRLVPA
jgi:AcrR family transcriptional regulator